MTTNNIRTGNLILSLVFMALTACGGSSGSTSSTPIPTSGVAVSAITASTTENSTEASFTVQLNTQPSSDVKISFISRDITEGLIGSDTDLDWWPGWGDGVNLTFTSSNWNVPQTIKVQGQPDYVIDGNQTYNVDATSIWSMDLSYIGVSKPSIPVTNIDTSAPGITVSKLAITTSENLTSSSFSIRLNLAPASTVTVPLTIPDATEGSFDYYSSVQAKSVTFDATNWQTAQSVWVYGLDDPSTDGNQTYTLSVGPTTSSDPSYNSLTGNNVSVTNTDNDTANYTVSNTSLSTNEWGQSAAFTVVLNTQPVSDVVIPVTSPDPSEGQVSSFALPTLASTVDLTFTSANWQTPQTVTVGSVDDAIQDGDISYNITVGAPTGDTSYAALGSKTVSVVNFDDDTAKVNIQGANLQTAESGTASTFVVSLAKPPTGTVVINVTSADITEGRVKGGNSPASPIDAISLTFTTLDWQTPRTVTVVGQDDVEIDGNQTYNVNVAVDTALTLDAAYDPLVAQNVSVTNADGDIAGMTVSSSWVYVYEAGTTGSIAVNLNTMPTADVVIPITLADATQIQVSNNGTVFSSTLNLTFTAANWSTAQTLTFKAIDDFIDEPTQNIAVTMGAATSTDVNYSGLAAKTTTAYVYDNDTAGLVVNPNTVLTTTEVAVPSTSFTLALATQPTSNIFVAVSSGNVAEGLLTGGIQTTPIDALTLEFTPANWQSGQTITILGQDDLVMDGPMSYQLTINPVSGTDSSYTNLSNKLVSVTNYDNEAGVSETLSLARTQLPYSGKVAKASVSTYTVSGLAAGWKHTITADFVTDDIGLTVKDGATTLCSSVITGIKTAESCAFTVPATGTVTVVIDGASTNNGASFTLSLSVPTYPVTFEIYNALNKWNYAGLYDASATTALRSITTYSGSTSLTYDLTAGAAYYLRITPWDLGNYQVQVTKTASLISAGTALPTAGEPDNDAASAHPLALDTPFASYIDTNDFDWYKFTAPAAPY